MASASRISQTVVRLIGLSSSCAARLARSVVDCRLNGLPVRATTSQAMEATTARSRGGKGGLAASPGCVGEGKSPFGPALPPAADAVGVEVEPGGEIDVGDRRALVQEQGHPRPLPQVRRRRASRDQPPGLGEELIGETRAVVRRRARHATALLKEQSLYPATSARQPYTYLPNGPLSRHRTGPIVNAPGRENKGPPGKSPGGAGPRGFFSRRAFGPGA